MNKNLPSIKKSLAPTVVAVGGIDPSAGAGLFIDETAILSTGCFFSGICATVTIQDGIYFVASNPQPPQDVHQALTLIHQNRCAGAIKTGALGSAGIIDVICQFKQQHPSIPLVVDPVLRSTSGGRLLASSDEAALQAKLLPAADLFTPNLQEAQALTGIVIRTPDDMTAAALALLTSGTGAVLLKGGHLEHDTAIDVLVQKNSPPLMLESPRLDVGEVRGTGCALASLAAAHIALGDSIVSAVQQARFRLASALSHARYPAKGPGILQFFSPTDETSTHRQSAQSPLITGIQNR